MKSRFVEDLRDLTHHGVPQHIPFLEISAISPQKEFASFCGHHIEVALNEALSGITAALHCSLSHQGKCNTTDLLLCPRAEGAEDQLPSWNMANSGANS